MRVVEISFHSPHPRLLPKGARGLLFPRRCLEAALAAGMDDYLSKPFTQEQLIHVVKRWAAQDTENSAAAPDRHRPFSVEQQEDSPAEEPLADVSPVVIDAKALDMLRGLQRPGRPDIVAKVVDSYLDSSPQLLRAIQEAVAQGNASALHHAAHSLKSSSANVGAIELTKLSKELEAMGRNSTLAPAAAVASRIEAELTDVWDALRAEIQSKAA